MADSGVGVRVKVLMVADGRYWASAGSSALRAEDAAWEDAAADGVHLGDQPHRFVTLTGAVAPPYGGVTVRGEVTECEPEGWDGPSEGSEAVGPAQDTPTAPDGSEAPLRWPGENPVWPPMREGRELRAQFRREVARLLEAAGCRLEDAGGSWPTVYGPNLCKVLGDGGLFWGGGDRPGWFSPETGQTPADVVRKIGASGALVGASGAHADRDKFMVAVTQILSQAGALMPSRPRSWIGRSWVGIVMSPGKREILVRPDRFNTPFWEKGPGGGKWFAIGEHSPAEVVFRIAAPHHATSWGREAIRLALWLAEREATHG